MADYRRFQPRRSPSGSNWRLPVFGAGVVLVVILIGMWAFGGGGSKAPGNTNEPSISLVNDQAQTNVESTNGNTNALDLNANTNTAVTTAPAVTNSTAILNSCNSLVSQTSTTATAVALTFDVVGDTPALTTLLEELAANKLPATFFITGGYAADHTDLVRKISNAGFAVYSRGTATAKKYTTLDAAAIAADLASADASISATTGRTTKPFYRPPQGLTNEAATAAAKTAGYCTVSWTVDANDWDDAQTVESAVARVLDKSKSGAIILLGAGNDIVPQVVAKLATEMPKKSLSFVTLAELFPST